MQTITTIGLGDTLPSRYFRSTALITMAKWSSRRHAEASPTSWAFFEEAAALLWSASRPVPRHTIGHASRAGT